MVSILNNQTSNEEFLEFATNEVHNVDVATTHHGAPSAQVCDLVLNKNKFKRGIDMVRILNNQTSNEEFLEFATNEVQC